MVPEAFAGGKHSWDDHGTDTDGRAFQGVVEILAMGGGAVDQRRAGRIEGPPMTEGRALSLGLAAIDERGDIILLPGGDAEPGHIQKVVHGDFLGFGG